MAISAEPLADLRNLCADLRNLWRQTFRTLTVCQFVVYESLRNVAEPFTKRRQRTRARISVRWEKGTATFRTFRTGLPKAREA